VDPLPASFGRKNYSSMFLCMDSVIRKKGKFLFIDSLVFSLVLNPFLSFPSIAGLHREPIDKRK